MTISKEIRTAAINWPQYLSDTACQIIDAFCYPYEHPYWARDLYMYKDSIQSRVFLLFVAEALE